MTNNETGKVIYDKIVPRSGTITLENPVSGTYHWEVYSSLEEKHTIDRYFTIASQAEAEAIRKDYESFCNGLRPVSPEMKEFLCANYYLNHNIIID
ncbi:hypothetical protein [Flavobacterium sp. 3HN19-14]|uniref:hypothetical protein n=1 Tax=Flavobacterium sp. 3HN19-14 TaxID=3448133 RepID=UPI003EE1BFAA